MSNEDATDGSLPVAGAAVGAEIEVENGVSNEEIDGGVEVTAVVEVESIKKNEAKGGKTAEAGVEASAKVDGVIITIIIANKRDPMKGEMTPTAAAATHLFPHLLVQLRPL